MAEVSTPRKLSGHEKSWIERLADGDREILRRCIAPSMCHHITMGYPEIMQKGDAGLLFDQTLMVKADTALQGP